MYTCRFRDWCSYLYLSMYTCTYMCVYTKRNIFGFFSNFKIHIDPRGLSSTYQTRGNVCDKKCHSFDSWPMQIQYFQLSYNPCMIWWYAFLMQTSHFCLLRLHIFLVNTLSRFSVNLCTMRQCLTKEKANTDAIYSFFIHLFLPQKPTVKLIPRESFQKIEAKVSKSIETQTAVRASAISFSFKRE